MDVLKPLPRLVEADMMQRCAAAIADYARANQTAWPGLATVQQEAAAGAYRKARRLADVEAAPSLPPDWFGAKSA